MANALIIIAALAAWGAFHSFTASLSAKAWAQQRLNPSLTNPFYRLVFNLVSVFTFLPVLALVVLLPSPTLYSFPAWLLVVTIPLQLVAALAAVVVLWQVDLLHFLGLRQLGNTAPASTTPPQLYTQGAYAWVRHPLYFFSLIFLWLAPVLTLNLLAFNLASTLYFYIGSIFEERKLVAEFGEAYRQHQRQVPRLLPLPRFIRKN